MKHKEVQELEAIVLGVIPYGEFDQIVSLYTRQHGKISGFAPSAKRSKKRFGGCFQIMAKLLVIASPPASSQKTLWRLQEAKLTDLYLGHRSHLFSLSTLSYFCECVSTFLPEGDPNEAMYEWLCNVLKDYPQNNDFGSMFRFEVELLSALGFRPSLHQCVDCLKNFEDKRRRFFSFEKGGVVCDQCSREGEGKMIESFPSLLTSEISRLDFIAWIHTFHDFLSFNSEKTLKSQSFRNEILYESL
ncbi:MAG: DNA repair protein RecO [Bdellovibrionota bacterium]